MKRDESAYYHLGDWLVDPNRNTLSRAEQVRRLEPLAMDVLVYLMSHAQSVVSSTELMDVLWVQKLAEPRVIAKRINQIRVALGDDARRPVYIETIPKRGYRLIASVRKPEYRPPSKSQSSSSSCNEKALDAFSRGMAHLGAQDYFAPWLPAATSEFKTAVEIDPDYSLAWSYLALMYVIDALWTNPDRFAEARIAAERALAADAELGVAHTALGYIQLIVDWDIPSATDSFVRAYALHPTDTSVLLGYQLLLRVTEQYEHGKAIAEKLKRLAPTEIWTAAEQIRIYFEMRMYEKAIAEAESVKALMPGYADLVTAAAYHKLGRFEESYQTRLAAYRLHGSRCNDYLAAAESGWDQNGYEGALRAIDAVANNLDPLNRDIDNQELCILFGNPEPTVSRLSMGVQKRVPQLVGLLHNPMFDEVRPFPEYDGLLESMNLDWVPPENPARVADVARIKGFRGQSASAIKELQNVLENLPNDPRVFFWQESLAWACFADKRYEQAVEWSQKTMEGSASDHCKSFALLVQAASYDRLSLSMPATIAWDSANRQWPGTLDLQRDVKPLFIGSNTDLEVRFFAALESIQAKV